MEDLAQSKTPPQETSQTSPRDGVVRDHRILAWQGAGADERHMTRKHSELLAHEKWSACWKVACKVVEDCGIIVLLGSRGNGKTQMGVELIRVACSNYEPTEDELQYGTMRAVASYTRLRDLHMTIRQAYGSAPKISEKDAVHLLLRPHLLVIDECQESSGSKDSDWAAQTFTYILDKRYGLMRPTVLIANCNKQQFVKLAGSSITDRIKEDGGFLSFDWPSFRGVK